MKTRSLLFGSVIVLLSLGASAAPNLDKVYEQHRAELNVCAGPATSFCGKKSRDLQITLSEFKCLHKKVFRVTREALRGLDGSECANKIREVAQKGTNPSPPTPSTR